MHLIGRNAGASAVRLCGPSTRVSPDNAPSGAVTAREMAECVEDRGGRGRPVDRERRVRDARRGAVVHGFDHFRDGRDTGDGFLSEGAERIGHRAEEPAVNVDGTAAHALDHTGVGERATFKAGQDEIALGADAIPEHADDRGPEFLERVAAEHRAADADHAGLQLRDGEEGRRLRPGRGDGTDHERR